MPALPFHVCRNHRLYYKSFYQTDPALQACLTERIAVQNSQEEGDRTSSIGMLMNATQHLKAC